MLIVQPTQDYQQAVVDRGGVLHLTNRERQVLTELLKDGAPVRILSKRLGMSSAAAYQALHRLTVKVRLLTGKEYGTAAGVVLWYLRRHPEILQS